MSTERRIRIGDWLMPYDDATEEVVIERNLADILRATPGSDQDCMNSRCIRAQRNARAFPHPVYVVSTIRTRVYIVDQLDPAGLPAHAVRYQLSDRDRVLINAHDRYGAGVPGELRLRVPDDPKGSPKRRAAEEASSSGGRFGNTEGRYSGDGKSHGKQNRPVTTVHSLGAKARYKVAVGALSDDRS